MWKIQKPEPRRTGQLNQPGNIPPEVSHISGGETSSSPSSLLAGHSASYIKMNVSRTTLILQRTRRLEELGNLPTQLRLSCGRARM